MKESKIRIAVLALQGAFIEHEQMLHRLGVETFEVRQLADWHQPKDGLIIPGGESTTMTKLLHELGLFSPIRQAIAGGLPVFGTCAGLILLAESITSGSQPSLATMHIEAVRNAYGRQLGSFHTETPFDFKSQSTSLNPHPAHLQDEEPSTVIPMTFIRAPYIKKVLEPHTNSSFKDGGVSVLAEVDGRIVAARQGNQLVTAFHPELDTDTRVHEYFLNMVRQSKFSAAASLKAV